MAGEIPDLTRPELEALQLERLRESLTRAYEKVPHYRAAFDEAGLRPHDVRDARATSATCPSPTKADLRDNYPFGMFAVPREQVSRVHASSGTTGRPTVVGYTADGPRHLGRGDGPVDPGRGRPARATWSTSPTATGCSPAGSGRTTAPSVSGCTVVPVSGGMTERQVQLIADFEPRVIMVTPSYFLAILDEMERQGLDPRASSLEVGIFGAEPWTDEMRASVEERSGIRAVDIYGLSEVMGPGVSQESGETQDGLHVWEDHFLPEIIDPVTGAVLPDGEEGELVFTSLTKQAMPVVRYRTRDLTRLLPGTAYPAFRRMQKVTGRTDDLMIVRGVNVFPSQIEEQLLTIEGLTPHYLCVLERPGNLDELTVQVEAAPGVTDRDGLGARLADRIKQRIGVTAAVEVVEPGALARSLGKAVRISDRR